jgi:uncharacterized repeat protein (TIGR01451 family)
MQGLVFSGLSTQDSGLRDMRKLSLLLCLVALGLATLQAQEPRGGFIPPPGKLHVRLTGDANTTISYLAAPNTWKSAKLPSELTLQPGARYLLKVENLPNLQGLTFYPTLEVLDVLYLPPKLKASEHPAPILFTEQDGLAVVHGAMVTKVVTLEDPESPFVGMNGNVNGADADPLGGLDALSFAKQLGRPVAILRWGNKEPTADDLAGRSLSMGKPVCGPVVPIKPFKLGEECLRDGGDFHDPAHFKDGKLKGLNPSDTVMTYNDRIGTKHILPSNPVCLCVPRFVSLREVTALDALNLNESAGRVATADVGVLVARKDMAYPAKQLEEGVILKRLAKAHADIGIDRVVTTKSVEGVKIIALLEKTKEVVGQEQTEGPCVDEGLELCKSISTDKAQIGDVVTFTIKYANKTCHAISDVAIADSLASRFEYVPGTAKSTREAIFVTTTNEAGSLVLRWELKDPVPMKQGGEVTFQARVR